jgi:predicted phage tail protein
MQPYKKRDITIRFIPNLLADEGRILKSLPYNRDWTIRRYLKKSKFDFKDMQVAVNGNKVEDLNKHLTVGDEITIFPEIEIAAIGAAIYVWWMSLGVVGATLFIVGAALTIYSIVSALMVRSPKLPTFNTSSSSLAGEGGLDEGPAYSWDGARTTSDVGRPIPVIYGERVVGGNVLNEYVSTDGNNSWLHTLLGIGWGELESITLRRINRNTATNYPGWSLTTRMGTLNQEVIPNFHDSHNLISIGVPLIQSNAYTYTTDGNDIEAFEIYLQLPSGLWQQDTDGSILSYAVTYHVEYKLHSSESWTDLGSTTISAKSRSALKRIFRASGLDPGQYDIRVTKTSAESDFTHTNDLYLERIDEISCEDEQIFPMVACAAVDSIALEQLSGAFPDYELFIKGRKIMTPQVLNGATPVPWDDYYWDPDDACYKLWDGTPLTWDGETFVTAYSANPIWCTYDLQINKIFGAGHYITAADNDIDYLIEQSQYCEERVPDGIGGYEKRFRMDIVIDSQQKALDLVLQLCTIFRAYPFYSDKGQVKIVVEKPEIPAQLFSPGNIIEKSFSESWGSRRDIPNVVNVQFDDEDNNYTTQTVQAVVDDEALVANKPLNSVLIRYYGVKKSYAIRYGRDYFKTLKYISNTIRFSSALGSMIRQCGEVIDIAHDVPQWGFGGTVRGAIYKGDYSAVITYAVNEAVTYEEDEYKCIEPSLNHLPIDTDYWEAISRTTIKLDRTVTIESGKSYSIRVDFARGGYEEKTVIDASGSYTEVNVNEAFSKTPLAYDIYSFGEVEKVVKPGRIMGITRNRSGEIEFEVPEYNENIFDDSAVIIPQTKYSSLSLSAPFVASLKLTERLTKLGDGTIEDVIDVWFDKPSFADNAVKSYQKARIYLSDNNGLSWEYCGETQGIHFSIVGGLRDGMTYIVTVVSVTTDGEEGSRAASPSSSITLIGKSAPPSDVSTFLVNQNRDRLYFGWPGVADIDLAGYEIRVGESWEAGYILATQIKNTSFISLNLKVGADQKFWIKAIDTSSNYSTNPTQATITIDSIPFSNIIESYSEQTGWAGSKTNTVKVDDNLEIAEGELSGTYETPVRDVIYVATFKIGIETVIVDASSAGRMNDSPTRRMNDSPTRRMSGEEVTGAASFEIKTSEDNITWSSWQAWQPGDYKCRYFQLRMTLARSDASNTIRCSEFNYYTDLPDMDENDTDEVTDAGTGKAVTFGKVFHEAPNVNIDILSGDAFVYKFDPIPDITGFTVKLYDLTGVAKTGQFSYHAHGV